MRYSMSRKTFLRRRDNERGMEMKVCVYFRFGSESHGFILPDDRDKYNAFLAAERAKEVKRRLRKEKNSKKS